MGNLKETIKTIPFLYSFFINIKRINKNYKDDFNLIKTLSLNFRALKFKDACKLPIFVYGKLKIYNIGEIIIDAKIETGMIWLGRNLDRFKASSGSAMIDNSGTIIFRGPVRFSVDCSIFNKETGVIDIGKLTFFGNTTKLYCYKSISIGKLCRIASECQIFDSGFHFMRNIKTGEIKSIFGEVIIGDGCWIGNRSTVARNSILPNYTIVASNSLTNKDFSNFEIPLLGGTPAKIISEKIVRIVNRDDENRLFNYFSTQPIKASINEQLGLIDETEMVTSDFIKSR